MKALSIVIISILCISCSKQDVYRYSVTYTMNSCDNTYESIDNVSNQYLFDHELTIDEEQDLIISDSTLVSETHYCSNNFKIYLSMINGVAI